MAVRGEEACAEGTSAAKQSAVATSAHLPWPWPRRVKTDEVVKYPRRPQRKQKQRQQQQQALAAAAEGGGAAALQQQQPQGAAAEQDADRLNPVLCAVCDTEVGLRDCSTGEYHLFEVVASNS